MWQATLKGATFYSSKPPYLEYCPPKALLPQPKPAAGGKFLEPPPPPSENSPPPPRKKIALRISAPPPREKRQFFKLKVTVKKSFWSKNDYKMVKNMFSHFFFAGFFKNFGARKKKNFFFFFLGKKNTRSWQIPFEKNFFLCL